MPLGQVQMPFPTTTQPGIRSQESGGRLINAYLEPLSQGAPSPTIVRRAPGLNNFGTTTQTGFRGGVAFQNSAFCAFTDRLVSFGAAGGAATDRGVMTGTAKGFFARNNRVPSGGADHGPDLVFVDPTGNAFSFDPNHLATPPATIVRPAGMGAPNSVCSIDGFLVYTLGNGQVWSSDLNDLTIQPLAFATAESKPDGLTRGVPWAGNLFLFGPATTEVWTNVGTAPFPFQRSVVIPRGIAGPYCVAGWEDNFSRALVWVADDNTVVRLNGYTPEKISPPDLDGLIEDVIDKTMLEMSIYMARGHAFLMLSASKASPSSPWPEWSWVFDLNNDRWAERNSYLNARSRVTGGFYAFNKWLCGDLLSGNLQEVTDKFHTEIGQPFRWRVESGAVENFPVGARVGRADFEFVTGVGIVDNPPRALLTVTGAEASFGSILLSVSDYSGLNDGDAVTVTGVTGTVEANGTWSIVKAPPPNINQILLSGSTFTNAYTGGGTVLPITPDDPTETDPVVEISWSDDGGNTWYAPIQRRLGRQAQTRELVSLISCTGRSGWTARRWRLDISDPVHVGFMAGYQNMSPKVSDIG